MCPVAPETVVRNEGLVLIHRSHERVSEPKAGSCTTANASSHAASQTSIVPKVVSYNLTANVDLN